MTTFAQLKTAVARDLGDESNKTFTAAVVGDFINEALIEVGMIAPDRFQEDIEPVADTLAYQLREAVFPDPTPEIEVSRVELWDTSYTPNRAIRRLQPAGAERLNYSATGWEVINGTLYLTNAMEEFIDPDIHLIRVWGYSPYPELSADGDVVGLSPEREKATRVYCRVLGLRRLNLKRDLYTQWQTASNNSDVSPAQLLSALAQAEDEWRRRSRRLVVLREAQ